MINFTKAQRLVQVNELGQKEFFTAGTCCFVGALCSEEYHFLNQGDWSDYLDYVETVYNIPSKVTDLIIDLFDAAPTPDVSLNVFALELVTSLNECHYYDAFYRDFEQWFDTEFPKYRTNMPTLLGKAATEDFEKVSRQFMDLLCRNSL